MLYPINFNLSARPVVVIGGGMVACRRVKTLLHTGAIITVVAPKAAHLLINMAQRGQIFYRAKKYDIDDLYVNGQKALFVIVATNNVDLNAQIAADAKENGIFVNMAAPPLGLSDFSVPSHIARGDILISVATSGASPAFSRFLRRELEKCHIDNFSEFAILLPELREIARQKIPRERRAAFWRSVLNDDLAAQIKAGKILEASRKIRALLQKL